MSTPRQLLATSLFLPTLHAQAELLPGQLDYSHQYYQESDDRIRVDSDYIRGRVDFTEDTSLRYQWLNDAISGASPTGAYDEDGNLLYSDVTDVRKGILGALSQKIGDHRVELEASRSKESDYLSEGLALSDTVEFNQKNTTLSYGINYLSDTVTVPFLGERDKKSYDLFLGVTQVIDKNTVFSANLTIGYNTGYLNDPYKVIQRNEVANIPISINVPVTVTVDVPVIVPVTVFIDDGAGGLIPTTVDTVVITQVDTVVDTTVDTIVDVPLVNRYSENRPDKRLREVLQLEGLHYFENADGALHSVLRLSHDDYGVFSQMLEVEWRQNIGTRFLATPFIRYYHQNAASFFRNDLNDLPSIAPTLDPDGSGENYSADYRLSSFNAISTGLKLRYQFNENFSASAAYEHYAMTGTGSEADRSADAAYITAGIWTVGVRAEF